MFNLKLSQWTCTYSLTLTLFAPQTHPRSPVRLSYSRALFPSFFAAKYSLLSHLWEWFCSLNITISTFSWPTETPSPPPSPPSTQVPIHTANLTLLLLLLLPPWHQHCCHPQRQPSGRSAIWVQGGFCTPRDLGAGIRRVRGIGGFVNLWSRSPALSLWSPLLCLVFIGLSLLPGLQQKPGEWICIPSVCFVILTNQRLGFQSWLPPKWGSWN